MKKSKLSRLAILLCVVVLTVQSQAQISNPTINNTSVAGVETATWIGPHTGGLWSNPDNWDTVEFPNNGNGAPVYNVDIMSEIFNPVVINLDTNVEINDLFLRGTIDAQSGSANLIINGQFDIQGSLLGPGTTTSHGSMIDPTLNAVIVIGGGRILENAGTATFRTPLGITISGGSQLNNLASGIINLQTTVFTDTDGELNNFGLLFTEVCCLNMQGIFNNHGLVEIRTNSDLLLYSHGTHSGVFHVADGTMLSFQPQLGNVEFTETSDITGSGDVAFWGEEIINLAGDFSFTGNVTVSAPFLNFANAPTSSGFTLDINSFSILPSVVSFDGGLPVLDELILFVFNELRIIGDANILGPVLWNGTMSGAGTTTTDGLVHAINGLILDGRTLIANGDFLWQGQDFELDNGAVFINAAGSTFDINICCNLVLITTTTPENPGMFINEGLVSQTVGVPARIMIDFQQTPAGVTNTYWLSFFGNTDISGTVIVSANSRKPMIFAGPDNGSTITHRLNSDSTLIAPGSVDVGEPFASGGDIINAEFAGSIDFSAPESTLRIYGENTTVTINGTLVNNTINNLFVDSGTLVMVLPDSPLTFSNEPGYTATPAAVTIKQANFESGSTMEVRNGATLGMCGIFFGNLFSQGSTYSFLSNGNIFDLFQDDFGTGAGFDDRFVAEIDNIQSTVTGNVDIGDNSQINLTNGASGKVDGANVFVGTNATVTSSDSTGGISVNNADIQLIESADPNTPSQIIGVPFVATNSNVSAFCPECPSRPHPLFQAGLRLDGICSFEHVDVTVETGTTVGPDAVLSLNDSSMTSNGTYEDFLASIGLTDSEFMVQIGETAVEYQNRITALHNSSVGMVDADGSSLADVSGTGLLEDLIVDDDIPLLLYDTIRNQWVASAAISPGDTKPNGLSNATQSGIGTLTVTGQEVVIDNGSTLVSDINPTGPQNDVLQIIADIFTFDATIDINITPGTECNFAPPDAFTIVVFTGNTINYPGGGDGQRVITRNGEGTFLVHQNPTGIVVDSFSLAADINGNGNVDSFDLIDFGDCMSGPGNPPPNPGCEVLDYNFDGHSDLKDIAILQTRFGTICN